MPERMSCIISYARVPEEGRIVKQNVHGYKLKSLQVDVEMYARHHRPIALLKVAIDLWR